MGNALRQARLTDAQLDGRARLDSSSASEVTPAADILTLDIASAIILNRGILTDRYDAPSASSPLDNQNIAAPVGIDQLHPGVGFSEDDGQPFPDLRLAERVLADVAIVAKPMPAAADV